MTVKESKKYYLAWADLVDFAFESLLKQLRLTCDSLKASQELKKTLRHQSDRHWQDMCSMLKKLK